jgi:predicted ATPase with chaperone activity
LGSVSAVCAFLTDARALQCVNAHAPYPPAVRAGRLEMAMRKLSLSARAYSHILKVARTIADLDGYQNVITKHLAEVVQYRSLDRNNWH